VLPKVGGGVKRVRGRRPWRGGGEETVEVEEEGSGHPFKRIPRVVLLREKKRDGRRVPRGVKCGRSAVRGRPWIRNSAVEEERKKCRKAEEVGVWKFSLEH